MVSLTIMMHSVIPIVAVGAVFGVEVARDWGTIKHEWDKLYSVGRVSVFQSPRWLTAWYESHAGRTDIEPFLLTVRDARTGAVAMHIPLFKHAVNGVRCAEFADIELSMYNAPLLGPAAPCESESLEAMWRALQSALRDAGVDLLRLEKMPVTLNGTPNPLALIKPAHPSSLNGNRVTTGDDFEAYRASIRHMQLARSWRVFARHPDAAFKIITDKQEAFRLLDIMDEQQVKRHEQLGRPTRIFENADFYRNLVASGISDGFVVMSALTSGEEIVGLCLGVRQGTYYVVLRISNAGERWSSSSPGRLVLERTMAALHADGVRQFDLGPGQDELKHRFGATSVPLADATVALTVRGLLLVHAAKWFSTHPRMKGFLRRALRRAGV